MFIPPALSTEINVGLSPVGSDDQRQPGGPGSGVKVSQVEPDQQLAIRLIIRQPGLVAAQAAAALQGNEGHHVVLTELDIVTAFLLL